MHRLRFMLDHHFARRRLSAYIDGELGSIERRRVERHIDECPDCDAVTRALRRMLGGLALLRGRTHGRIADDVRARLRARWPSGGDGPMR